MRKKITSIIIAAALTLAGCAEGASAGDGAGITYKVVGGISEPVRVWNADAGLTAEEASEPGEVDSDSSAVAYVPDVLAMEPTLFVTNKPACTYTSDKDGEVVDELDEGAELTLVGTTGKGYYQTEGGSFISASDVERAVEVAMVEEEAEPQEKETKPTTTTTTQPSTTTEAQPQQEEQPQQQEQPSQEQQSQPVQQEQTAPAPQPEPTPAPEPTPQPTPEPQPQYTYTCGDCGATFATEEELDNHMPSHANDILDIPENHCSHNNGYQDDFGWYCYDCGGYVD